MFCMNVLNQTTLYQHGMPLMSLVHIYRNIPLEASNYQAINVTDYRLIAFVAYGAAYSLAAPVYFMHMFNILITSNCINLVCGYWTCKQGNFGTGILGAPLQNTFSIQWITTEHPNLFINQVHDLEKFPFDLWTPHISGHNSSHFSLSCMFHYLVASYVLGYYINYCTVFISSPLDKMTAISQTIFSDAFSWMENFVFWLKFRWGLCLRVQLTITQNWFR